MTDEPSQRKRKRWQWIIAGVLSFVVAVAGWWYYPRGDARFVGRWQLVAAKQPPNVIATTWNLKRNGEMWMTGSYITPAKTIDYYSSWRTEDSTLVTGWNDRSWKDWLLVPLQSFLNSVGVRSFIFRRESWKILSVNDDEIVLQATSDNDVYSLKRLPE